MPRVWIFTNWPILCGGIGSYDAVNYDGGGSSTMVLRDEDEKAKASFIVRNRPSDGSPRAVGNGLAIVEKD